MCVSVCLCVRPLTRRLVEYVSDLCESDQKFLVFAYHMDVLDALEHALTKKDGAYRACECMSASE